MFLSSDGVWSISKTHLKILETIDKLRNSNLDFINLKLKIQGFNNFIRDLCKLKFIRIEEKIVHLTISGMDCLAINALRLLGLEKMGSKISIGKESDIFYGIFKGKEVVLKFHRLGRTSFKSVKNKRNYTKEKTDWFKLNKISCEREANYYEIFKDLDIPKYYTHNRHVIVLELLDFNTLYSISLTDPPVIFNKMIDFVKDLCEKGYVHGDFNEFNVMVKGNEIKVIDFPQCVPNTDKMALDYLKRDFECIETFFKKKYFLEAKENVYEEFVREN
ncbi:Serine/threonine-protein kinase RIO2 [Nosema bombycis CQ1]|uniref:non-specific serine/threonine protein kinase n=1 Tax=Nosema bombycis (strain CQ1 / CVCC 102059) TaxID=578461 RepID=R0MIQ5_NOSB1|nr:Serine/threonine-protein kinase RIO2 [Nosema bombycis CQ1]|eukprot:EOB14065.1 Serine/threonine-protein kinase RIO2 [Nosema bombycis CQ1]